MCFITYMLLRLVDYAIFIFFFFNATATTEIYTLSLHDALPICLAALGGICQLHCENGDILCYLEDKAIAVELRSEEHTSELQSRGHLVCRLLLEKKKEYAWNL